MTNEPLGEAVEPVADTVGVKAADMRRNLTKMIADVIAMHPCYRDVDGHQGADCPQARAVIESLSRPPALRALVELAPDHPRKPVLPEPRPVALPTAREDGEPDECERADCRQIAATASDVYCDVTGGLLSYPTYDARTILAEAGEYTQRLIGEETARLREEIAAAIEGEKSSNEFRNVVLDRAAAIARGRVVMTPDERLNEIEQGWNTPYDCRVCVGLSPSWDGHDRSCRGRVWESVPWLIGQLRDARVEIDEVGAQVHIQHDRAIRAEAALVDARAEVKRLTAERNIAVNTAVAKTPNFDVVAARIQCEQREAADRRAAAVEAELAAERAKVERVEAMCNSGVFDVREWGERGTPFSNGAERALKRVCAALTGGEQ